MQIIEECIEVTLKKRGKLNKLRYTDIVSAAFNLGVAASGNFDSFQLQFGDDLFLCQVGLPAKLSNIAANRNILPDFLIHIEHSNRFAMNKLQFSIDFSPFQSYNCNE